VGKLVGSGRDEGFMEELKSKIEGSPMKRTKRGSEKKYF